MSRDAFSHGASPRERGAEWERLLVEGLDQIEELLERVEHGLAAGEFAADVVARREACDALQRASRRLLHTLDHAPGRDEWPDERIHVLGARVRRIGERCLAAGRALGAELPS